VSPKSGAVAIPAADLLPITIKNTFITVDMPVGETSPQRRSSSLPPSLRSYELENADSCKRCNSEDSTAAEVSDDDMSTVSPSAWAAGPDACAVLPGGATTPPSVDSCPAASRSCLNPNVEDRQPGVQPAPPLLVTTPGCGKRLPLQVDVPPFRPLQSNPVQKVAGKFRKQCGQVVNDVKVALEGCTRALNVEVSNQDQSWFISVHVVAEDLRRTEYVMRIAKEALLETTRNSSSVKVMGHRLTPFLPAPRGFMATLGAVQNESKACYDAYGKGFCHRGSGCRWQHPPCMGSVSVTIVAPHVKSR